MVRDCYEDFLSRVCTHENPLGLTAEERIQSGVKAPDTEVVRLPDGRFKVQPVTLKRVGALTVFQEAREQIDQWEKEYPRAEHLVLVLEAGDDLCYTVAGETLKDSAAAGLLFSAAQDIVA